MVELTDKTKKVPNTSLKQSYINAYKDNKFKKLVNRLKCKEEIAMKYTSSLEDTVEELNHCSECKGLPYCTNRLEGHVYYPEYNGKKIVFSYAPCKYYNKALLNDNNDLKDIANAKMSDIDTSDKKRSKVIKWIATFAKNYEFGKTVKGLYLHGNFGCGKTYLISALFNELKNKKAISEIVYFPELLREIKGDFDNYSDKMEYLKNVDLLLIDDIGAEKVTEWGRDEILGTILQSRMNNHKTTFFTSNLNIEELERHLTISNYSDDAVKARRIIERIKQLTEDIEMISENRRK
ncbi:MAG: AFG1/ZapE family ATPase [Bacilli bacterium]